MNVTREQAAELARRRDAGAACPIREGWDAGVLTVWVPGRPSNPLNGSHAHWSKRARWAKGWRERTGTTLLPWLAFLRDDLRRPWTARMPKMVTFTIHGAARFDDDNLRAVCKPVRDALKDMAIIDDDRPSSGHVFRYEQAKPSRKAGAVYGIALSVRLA